MNAKKRILSTELAYLSDANNLSRSIGISVEPHLENQKVLRRISREGELMPIMGLIVDPLVDVSLEDCDTYGVEIEAKTVIITEGTVDGRWHFVVVRRSFPESRESWVHDDFIRMRVLHRLGIFQVIGATIGAFLFSSSALKTCVVPHHPDDIREQNGSQASSSSIFCPRLRMSLIKTGVEEGFQVGSSDYKIVMSDVIMSEVIAARVLNMCYANIDMEYSVENGTENISRWFCQLLRKAPQAISPVSSCECISRREGKV